MKALLVLALVAIATSRHVSAAVDAARLAEASLASDDLAGCAPVPDDELARNRGGFVWSGVEISLGAEMRTYLNGALVLQTDVSWTPSGAQKTQFVSGVLTPVDASTLQSGLLAGGGISVHVGDQSVFLANQGQTLLAQRTDNGFQNVLVNRASNVEVNQQLDATINLKNFAPFQNSVLGERIGTALGNMIGEATRGW